MARTLVMSMLLGLTLVSIGCYEPRRHWSGDRQDRVDINNASQRQLSRLPGISDEDATRIIANRPYPDTEALVRRGVIGPRKYDDIERFVYAGGGRRERHDYEDRDDYRYDDDRYDHR